MGSDSAKVKDCILIWLAGGPSHIDTFDPKPDAAVDVRGEFKPIATSVPGVTISEVFPNLAKVMNRITLIRSMTSPEADHDRASHHLLTGYRPLRPWYIPATVALCPRPARRHAACCRRLSPFPTGPFTLRAGF